MAAVAPPPPVRPGAFGLVRAHTWGQRAIAALEGMAGIGSPYIHAFLVLDDGEQIGAMPGPKGAVIGPLQPYLDRHAADPDSVVFCDAPIRRRLAEYGGGDPDGHLEAALRRMVAAAGRTYEGRRYSFLDYVWLAAVAVLGERAPLWLRRLVESTRHVICSQLVDAALHDTGIEVFTDGRFAGSVTPGHLGQYREDWLAEQAGLVTA